MKIIVSLFAFVALAAAVAQARNTEVGFADRLTSTFNKWNVRATTEAQAIGLGYTPQGTKCLPGLGMPYTEDTAVTQDSPFVMFYNPSGFITAMAVGIRHAKEPSSSWWAAPPNPAFGDNWTTVNFRDPALACDNSTTDQGLLLGPLPHPARR